MNSVADVFDNKCDLLQFGISVGGYLMMTCLHAGSVGNCLAQFVGNTTVDSVDAFIVLSAVNKRSSLSI